MSKYMTITREAITWTCGGVMLRITTGSGKVKSPLALQLTFVSMWTLACACLQSRLRARSTTVSTLLEDYQWSYSFLRDQLCSLFKD